MRLVDQWNSIEARLPEDWQDVRLTLATEQPGELSRAAAVLSPVNVGRVGDRLVFHVRRAGGPSSPDCTRRLFARLDEQRVWCELECGAVTEEALPAEEEHASIADAWDAALSSLPGDWSELLCRLELSSSDNVPRAALLCAPLNPTRDRGGIAFLFRAARVGFGASAGMARRCLERLDDERIQGSVSVLRVLADTRPVASQGSSWIVGGRFV